MTGLSDKANALAAQWDERYLCRAAEMAGAANTTPNSVLRSEAKGLETGRALDIGCGLVAEAIWLAQRGWKVAALDVSSVALQQDWHVRLERRRPREKPAGPQPQRTHDDVVCAQRLR